MTFENLDTKCPFCDRKRVVKVSHLVPRQVFDCPRCQSILEVRPLKKTERFALWACDWTIAGVAP